MLFRLATAPARWVLLLVAFWQAEPAAQAQVAPPTYKGGLTLTKPPAPWRFDLTGGRQFFGRLDLIQGRLRIPGSVNWSASLSYGWRSDNRFTITYVNQPSELRLNSYGPFEGLVGDRRLTDLTVHYILAGSIQEFPTGGPVQPFVGGQLGLVVFDPRSARFGSETRMAASLTGGFRGNLTGPLGWKVQTMLLMPILWTEGGLFCGPGGCSIGLAGGSAILQMNANAGLTLSF